VDWLIHRRPIEGTRATDPTVADLARDDVVACALSDRVGEISKRVAESPYPFALVVQDGVVLGRLPASKLGGDPEATAEQVMEPGPSTVRPHKTAAGVAHDLAEGDLRWAIVTTPEGELIGVAARQDLEAAVEKQS
jgi:predicted transcriptional regulator